MSPLLQNTASGSMDYLLEVEMAETTCKKYLPIIDQSKCPLDPTEDKIVCQVRTGGVCHARTGGVCVPC